MAASDKFCSSAGKARFPAILPGNGHTVRRNNAGL